MSQSNVIFGYLLASFIIFVTLKGKLPVYINLLRGRAAISGGDGSTSLISGEDNLENVLSPNNLSKTKTQHKGTSLSDQDAGYVLDLFDQYQSNH